MSQFGLGGPFTQPNTPEQPRRDNEDGGFITPEALIQDLLDAARAHLRTATRTRIAGTYEPFNTGGLMPIRPVNFYNNAGIPGSGTAGTGTLRPRARPITADTFAANRRDGGMSVVQWNRARTFYLVDVRCADCGVLVPQIVIENDVTDVTFAECRTHIPMTVASIRFRRSHVASPGARCLICPRSATNIEAVHGPWSGESHLPCPCCAGFSEFDGYQREFWGGLYFWRRPNAVIEEAGRSLP